MPAHKYILYANAFSIPGNRVIMICENIKVYTKIWAIGFSMDQSEPRNEFR